MNMDTLLRQMIEKEASDLHIKVGSPPGFRIDGDIKPIEGWDRITAEKSEELAREVVAPERWEEFSKSGDLDFGHSVSGLARFRVNVLKQRGSCGMVIRKIPFKFIAHTRLLRKWGSAISPRIKALRKPLNA